jgi:hypothetical protein
MSDLRSLSEFGETVAFDALSRPAGLRLAAADQTADLTSRVAAVARRLAHLIEESCSVGSATSEAVDFLRSWADAATSSTEAGDENADLDTPWDRLVSALGLGEAEQTLLLLAGLPDEHEGLSGTLRSLHPAMAPAVTVGLAARVLDDTNAGRVTIRKLLVAGRAVRHGALRIDPNGPFFERSLVLPNGLWAALHGHPTRAVGDGFVVPTPVPGLEDWLADPAVRRAVDAMRSSTPRLLLAPVDDPAVAMARSATLADACGRTVVAAHADLDDRATLQQLLLDALMCDAVPMVLPRRSSEQPGPVPFPRVPLVGPLVIAAAPGKVVMPTDLPLVSIPLLPLSTADRRRAWASVVRSDGALAATLAARHPLDPALTAPIGLDLRTVVALDDGYPINTTTVSAAVRARAASELPAGVQLLPPQAGWSQLVLPADASTQLLGAVSRWEHQSTVLDDWKMRTNARAAGGVRLLLTGLPGTGKSLAGEVIAKALDSDLLRVDISHVVSKWLGETEQNLKRIFDIAERTQAVLMLDEADALFGARTDISDAHDRYANLETAYLLQRLDHFDGLAVLASNLKHNIDAAFLRRMDFVVEFQLPDATSRRTIWNLHVPQALRADDVDVDDLAQRYAVPGAWIQNAAIAAAFLAAPEHAPITTAHIVAGLRREYVKAAKPFPEPPDQSPVRDLGALRAIEVATGVRTSTEELL